MKYEQARELATQILKKLEPFCKRIDVVGSVRREKPEVKDIEIICVPKTVENKDLFGTLISEERNSVFISQILSLGITAKGDARSGRYCQVMLPDGIFMDLFMPQENDYIRNFVIRTGSSEYSHKVIATAWKKIGWVGTEDGLRMAAECYSKDIGNGKKRWICNSANPTLPPYFETELDFFEFINVPWIEPNKRNIYE